MDHDEELSQSLSDLSSSLSSLGLSTEELHVDIQACHDKIAEYIPCNVKDLTKPILGSFIDNLPPDGNRVLCQHILEKNHHNDLYKLGDYLAKAILAPMKACGRQTPATTDSLFGNRDDMASEMVESCTQAPLSYLKALCLERDDYRCVLSGRFAKEAVGRYPTVPDNEIRRSMTTVHISHIMPFSLGFWENDIEAKKKSNTWTTMFALFPGLRNIIQPEQINAGRNLMILRSSLNDEFGALELALEPTGDDRTYKIVTYPNFAGAELDPFPPADGNGVRFVTFHHHGGFFKLPSRTLLSTHAAIARILHASGMAEVIDRVLQDAADIKCLASDGSTDVQNLLPALLAC